MIAAARNQGRIQTYAGMDLNKSYTGRHLKPVFEYPKLYFERGKKNCKTSENDSSSKQI